MSGKKNPANLAIARLHGKGSMSEVLQIERQRLMQQAAEEMQVQLDAPAAPAPKTLLRVPERTPAPSQPRQPPQDGISQFSRFVSDDLSEFEGILIHSAETVSKGAERPGARERGEIVDPYYSGVIASLPFAAQQRLLATLCRLTLNWGSLSCRITLDLLSTASGIRNFKTLRRWLADLQDRGHLRYTPIHGDLRGSVIELTPPKELRLALVRQSGASQG